MAPVSWKNAVSGNWTVAANWSTGAVPGASDDATVGMSGSYTVLITSPVTVGSIAVSNDAATLSINDPGQTETVLGALTNAGTLDIDTDGNSVGTTLDVGGGLDSSGTVNIGTGNGAGGSTVSVTGTLENTGSLTIGNDSASATVVTAQAFADTGTLELYANASGSTTLDISAGAAPSVLATTITLTGDSLLEFASGEITSIAGSGKLVVGGTDSFVADAGATTTNSALTDLTSVAGEFELQSGASVALGGSLAVTGTLNVDGYSSFDSTLSVGGNLSNSGTVNIGYTDDGGGSTVDISGALDNSGTVNISDDLTATPTTVTAATIDNTGTLNLIGTRGGQAVLDITAGAAPSVLATTITLTGDSLLEFASGEITSIAGSGKLVVGGTDSFVADAGATTTNSALTDLTSVAGEFELQSGASVALGGSLAVTGTLNVDGYSSFDSTLSVGGNLSNSGTVNIGYTDDGGGSTVDISGALDNSGTVNISDDLTATPTTVTAATIDNTGTLNLIGTRGGQAVLDITAGAAPSVLATTITLTGDSLLEFASGEITSIAGSGKLVVGGTDSFVADAGATTTNSALTDLTSVAGEFELQSGASVALGGSLAVTGTLNVDGYSSFDSTLSVGGNLSNSGTVNIGYTDDGGGSTVDISGALDNSGTVNISDDLTATPTTVTAATIDNTGTLNLIGTRGGQAVLDITAGAAPSVLATTITLTGDSLLEFASGEITSIAGSGKLVVGGTDSFVADAGATTTNSALTDLTSVAGEFELQSGASVALGGSLAVTGTLNVDGYSSFDSTLSVGGNLSNSGTVNIGYTDDGGGSTVDISGALDNSGTVNISDDLTATPTTVTAATIDNTGTLNLIGTRGGQAVLDITAGAAPSVLATTITLTGDSLLEFASGEITSIAGSGKLVVGGTDSFVADAGATTTNSALTDLTSVAGEFELQSGASVALGGSLAVTGTLNVDGYSSFDSTLSVGGNLSNSGTVNIGYTDDGGGSTVDISGALDNSGTVNISDDLTATPTTVTAATIDNTGTLNLIGTRGGQAVLDITAGAAPSVLATTITLTGDSLLEFASGEITSVAAGGDLVLNGANSFVADASDTTEDSALAGLQSIAGTLSLQGGAAVATTGALTVSGSLSLKGSTLTAAGPVTVTGNSATTVSINATSALNVTGGNSFTQDAGTTTVSGALNASTIDAAGGRMDFTDAVTAGAFEVGGDGLLEFDSTVGSSVGMTFTDATGTLQLNDPGAFAATIAGAEVGDVIHLIDTAVTGLSFANGVLTASGSGGTVASLNFSGSYTTPDFSFSSDGSGGTNIVVTQGTAGASLWTDSSGASWSTSANWTNGTPTSATNAIIGVPGSYTVTLANSASANSLALSDSGATLEIDAGGSLAVAGNVTNAGTVNLIGNPKTSGGAAMTVGGNFTNTGTLDVDNYDFFFNAGGSTLNIAGTLINSGTLAIGNTPFGGTTAPTTVTVQALDNSGSVLLQSNATVPVTLDVSDGSAPATLTGTLHVDGDALAEFASGAITAVANTGNLLVNGPDAFIAISGATTSNSALTGLSSNAGTVALEAGVTLTIAPAGGTFDNSGSFSLIGGGASTDDVNGGSTAGADVAIAGNFDNTGTLGVDNYNFFGVSGGSTLTITGTLTNSGTVVLGNNNGVPNRGVTTTAPATLVAAAFDNTGSLYLEGDAAGPVTLDITGQDAPAVLTAAVHVDNTALLEYAGGGIISVASSGILYVNGPQAFVADSGATTSNSALTGLSSNAGTVSFSDGAAVTITPAGGAFANSGYFALEGNDVAPDGLSGGSTAGAEVTIEGGFDNTGTLGVDEYNFFGAAGGSTLTVTGALTNSGTVTIGNSYRLNIDTTAPATLIAGALDNSGSVYLQGQTGAQATLDVTGQAAPTVLTAGLYLAGDALLQYASGEISTVAANATLAVSGPDAFVAVSGATDSNSALTGLSSNAGTVIFEDGAALTATPAGGTFANSGYFGLEGNNVADDDDAGLSTAGAEVTITGGFDNTGSLGVDDYSFFGTAGGSTLTITGALTNIGTVTIGDLDAATAAPATLIAGALDNTGAVHLYGTTAGPVTLDITGAAPTTLNGSINLSGPALLEFASGSITTIAFDASLTLNGAQSIVADSSNTAASGALSGLATNAGNFELENGTSVSTTPAGGEFTNTGTLVLSDASLSVTGDLDNSSTLDVDQNDTGGSTLSVTGTLADSGNIVIGNSGLTTATTVTAGALDVTGTLALTGTASDAATLDISGAAPSTLTGTVTLTTHALLEFGSGSFTTIASGASLTLDGGGAVVADTGDLYDSALSGLSSIDGTLSLLNGAGVEITGDLTNAGALLVDAAGNSTGASSLSVAATLDNEADLAIGNVNIGAQSTLTAGALINEGDGTVTLTGSTSGATADLTVEGNLTNEGNFQLQPGAFLEVGSLDNSGIFGLAGSIGLPTDLGVIGNATNSGALTIGAFAQLGITGSFDNSGNIVLAGTLDVAGPMTVDAPSSLWLQGGSIIDQPGAQLTIASGASLVGNGTIDVPVVNDGTIAPSGGLLDITGAITGTGQLNIGAASVLELGGASAEIAAFGGNVGTVKLDVPASFIGAFTGLVQGDTIDLGGIQATSAVVSGSTLTVTAGTQTLTYQVSGPGLASNVFALENDQHGGTDLVLGPPGPVIDGPNTQTVFTGLPAVLGPLSIADPTAGNSSLTVTLSDTAGLLSAAPAGVGTVGGDDTNALTLTGDLTDLNAMLASLTYGGASAVTDTVNVQVTDADNLTTAQTIVVTNEAVPFTRPEVNAPAQELVIVGTSTALGGITVSDPYAEATGQPVTLHVNTQAANPNVASLATLTISGPPGATITGQSTNDLIVTGTVAQVNADLADPLEDLIPQVQAAIINIAVAVNIIITSGAAPNNELAQAINEALSSIGEALKAQVELTVAVEEAEVTYVSVGSALTNLATFDGQFYDFNAAGEFVLAQSTQSGDLFQVQVRLQPYNGSAAVSAITQVAAGMGSDRVTIGIGRADPVWVDGVEEPMAPGETITLAAGKVTELSTNTYLLGWNTGEIITVINNRSYLDVDVGLPSGDAPGSIVGLTGSNGEPQADSFELPDGTVLQQPLTSAELYGTFANAWRVTQADSLFDYGPGQSTATFTNTSFPEAAVTLADLPASVVAQAAQAVAAAGITNPVAAAAAEFDYIASGDNPALLEDDASQFQGLTTTPATITPSSPPPPVLGVMPAQTTVPQSQTGPTAVTFDVYLTQAESSGTTVDYTAITPDATDLNAQDFGGTLPSGEITIAAGDTANQFTIEVPEGALGTSPSANVAVEISSPGGVPIFASTAQEAVTQPAAGPPAVPQVEDLTAFGNFTQDGNNYTLDLGAVQLGETLPTLQFGIVNAATAPADQLTGTFTVATVVGFTVTGDSIPSPIDAGDSYQGLTVTINQDKFGAQDETITFDPVDTNASGYTAPLTPITLTIADTLELPGLIYSQAWGDVHITTYNGLVYNFQASGDFVLAESRIAGDNFQIQMQLAPWYTGASVTTIHEVAIALGSDEVTFAWNRANTVLVDGAATALSMADPTLALAGGTITEVSPSMYQVNWNTGETMTVSYVQPYYPDIPALINITDGIPGNVGPGAYAGLQGEDEGTQNDIQLADGQVLPQPVSSAELYGEYANSWAVTSADSLFDAPLVPTSAPTDPVTLADLPPNLVNQAAALVAAAGITDPGIAQAAELDYLATGDPIFITAAANVQQQVVSTTPATVTPSTTPAAAVGVMANATSVTEATSGDTAVSFTAYLTGAETSNTVVDYTVISPGTGYLGASAFGGTLPSGSVTITAGQTTAQFTIEVPPGALGSDPSDILQVQVSDPDSIPIFAPTAQTEIVNNQPEPGNLAQPVLAKVSGDGTLSFDAATNTYTLVLGGLTQGTLQAVNLAVVNAATVPADSLGGTFTPPTGTGFIITGDNLPSPLAPEQIYQGLYVAVNTAIPGSNTMKMMFDPTDVNDSGYSAALTPITLDITDSVVAAAQAQTNTPTTIVFPNVHVGGTDSQHVSITNTATSGAAGLDVTLTPSGNAIASGTITQLSAGATDATDLTVGINASSAGALGGSITENFVSDAGGGVTSPIGMQDPYIDVFGDVYRFADPSVAPNNLTVHVGAPGTQTITITNLDPNDGYSENLIATVVGTTGAVTAEGTTGDIAPQADGTIAVKFSTATAGSIGTVTLDLKSDGTGIDGLGVTDLGDVTIPVSVTSGNVPAAAQVEEISGGGTFTQNGSAYNLNLGTITAPTILNLGVLNSAAAPADDLGGTFGTSGPSEFTMSGFGAFSGVAAGSADSSPTVTLFTGVAGTFIETITLQPSDTTTDTTLPDETLTITGTVSTATPPVITAPSAVTVQQSQASPVTGISITDPDAISANQTVTVNLFDGAGLLSANTGATGGGGTITGTGTLALTVSGTLTQVNADLTTLTDTDSTTAADSITVEAADSVGGIATPASISVTVQVAGELSGQVSLTSATEGVALTSQTVATFTDTNASDTASTFTATINWGDGTTSAGTITGSNGAFAVAGSHTYADEGSDPLTVTVTDTANTATLPLNGTVVVAEGDVFTPQGVTFSANPGQSFTGTVATFTDTDTVNVASDFTATINWGDGTSPTTGTITDVAGAITVTGTHTYAATGQDAVTVTLSDNPPGTATATADSTANVGQQLAGQITLTSATEGVALTSQTVATFTDTNASDTASTFTATINWGDGTTSAGTITGSNGAFAVAGSHTYADEGSDPLTVTVTDTANTATLPLNGTVVVAEGDVFTPQGVTFSANPGQSFTGTVATFTDTDTVNVASDFTATINWGDGTSPTTGTITDVAGAITVTGTHTYAATGQDAVTVTLSDNPPGTATATADSTANVGQQLAGQITLTSATEGVALTSQTVATFTDTNASDTASTFTATINWGDGTTSAGTITGSNGAFAVAGSHTYADEGSDPLTVTVTDTANTATLPLNGTVVVAEGDVFTPQGVTFSANPGQSFTGTVATFTDTDTVNVASDFTATINWGDGTSPTTGTITDVAGAITVTGTHTYAATGQDAVTVTLSDNPPGTATATADSTANVGQQLAGQITLTSATEGVALTSQTVATFTDTNASDTASTFTATINWGDGTTSAGTITGSNGAFAVAGSHTYADEGSDPLTVTVTDTANTATLPLNGTVVVAEGDVFTPQGVTFSANPGQSFTGTVATFTDTDTVNVASDFTATINWGDGTSPTTGTITDVAGAITVTGTHTYAATGQDAVTVTLSDNPPGTATATADSTANVGQQLAGQITLTSATEGVALTSQTVATFTDTNASDTASTFTATINWGDGTTSAGTITGSNGAFAVAGSHTYADEGSDPLTVTVTDTANTATLPLNGTVVVAEGDVFTPQGVTFSANPGQSFTGTVATFTDTDTVNVASDFTATINWGDGTSPTTGTITDVAGAITVTGTHTYAATGQDAVTVTLSDNPPGTATATADSTANVGQQLAGQITLTSATEGVALTSQTVATFTDTNASDTASTFTATINWGDGTTSAGTITGSNGAFAVAGSHTYADEGSDPLTVTVTDTANTATLPLNGTVVVAEGDVFTPQGVTFSANPGQSFTGTVATFTDTDTVNVASDFTATINWGDGTSPTTGTITDVAGAITVTGTHTYAATGQDAVTVTLSDNPPGTATATADSTANVGQQLAGQITLTSATEGVALTSQTVATFTDTNASDTASTFTATINWGDGTTSAGTITGSNGAFAVAGSHTYADEGSDPLTVTVTDTANTATLPLNGTVVVAEGDVFTPQGVTFSANPGQSFTGTVATFTDTDTVNVASDFTATINWGDGTSPTTGTITDVAGAITVTGTHTYAATGQDAVTVTLSDNPPGTATATADSTANVNAQSTTVTLTIDPVDGNNVINNAEAHAASGVPVIGTETGLATGAAFTVTVTDGTFAKGYTATVAANGSWTTTIPSADALMLANGTATVTAQVNSVEASEQVTVAETLPTVTINEINGDDIINKKVACGGGYDDHKGDHDNDHGWQGGQQQQTSSQWGGGAQGSGWGQQYQQTSWQGVGWLQGCGDDDDDGDDKQQRGQDVSAVTLSGTVSGIAANRTFQVMVSDGAFSKSYTATVNAAGTGWTATIPAADVTALPNGKATVTAQVTDQYGNTSLPAVQLVTVEGTPPIVLSVMASPSTGDLDAGKMVTITLTMNEAVKVTGCPALTLNGCGTAIFDPAHSTSTSLVFDYTVASGQNTSDLKITGVDLPCGASIQDLVGDNADMSGAAVNLGLVIDTITPTVCNVVASPSSGEVTTGHTVAVTLDMSKAVTVTGTPTLLLNDGGTASYDAAQSTATALTFDYKVAAGQVTKDLAVSGIELPSTSSIEDLAGNNANLSGADANLGLEVNTKNKGAGGSSGTCRISGGAEFELFGASTANAIFGTGSAGMLRFDDSSQFSGTIAGLAPGDCLDLADIGFGANTTLGYAPNSRDTGGTLTVTGGGHTANIALLGQYATAAFVMASDGHGGTLITDPPALIAQTQLTQPHA